MFMEIKCDVPIVVKEKLIKIPELHKMTHR
jgi:hypothetical protein